LSIISKLKSKALGGCPSKSQTLGALIFHFLFQYKIIGYVGVKFPSLL